MGCRRLYALVKNLPSDAALWRVQQSTTETNGHHEQTEYEIDWKGRKVKRVNAQELKEFLGGAGVGIGS